MIIMGVLFSNSMLINLGIIFFAAATVFQLITLPVEFNASSRAIKALAEGGLLYEDELSGAKKTLTAAALTYVAALAVSLAQLLRLIFIFGGRDRD